MSVPADFNLNLEQQRKRAKDLRRAHRNSGMEAAARIGHYLPRARNLSPETILRSPFTLSEAQFVIAREAGFPSWPNLKRRMESPAPHESEEALIAAALEDNRPFVDAVLARDPTAPRRSLHAAAVVADAEAASALLQANPEIADLPGGRRAWKPLLYLCSSRYRRGELGPERAAIARRLIELGAALTGRAPDYTSTHGAMLSQDNDLFAIEAAAGRSATPELVRLLLEGGADLKETTVALLQAVRGGNLEILRILLDALPREVSWQANWAIQESVTLGNRDMLRLLAGHVELPAEGALQEAIRLDRDPETIEILLGSVGPSGQGGRRGQKLYRSAVRYGNTTAAGILARWGADQSAVTDVDRVLGTCVAGDRTALRALLDLNDHDHQMLAWAIRTGRPGAVPLLLEAGLDPNVPDTDGETPLHLAVRSGSVETVDLLLRSGAVVDEGNFDAQTPLEAAIALPDAGTREGLVRRLLDAGASPSRMSGATEDEDPALLFERAADAVVSGDLQALREMLDREPHLAYARSPRLHRATLLHYCGANGVEAPRQRTPPNAPAIAQLLLDRGSRVDATCGLYRGGATTLGLMLSSCFPLRAGLRTALCEVLLNAEMKFKGEFGPGGLPRAAGLGRLDAVQRFFDGAGNPLPAQVQSAFWWACDFGRTSVAEYLLDKGADLSAQNGDGQTALHLAALSGHLDTVQLLLRRDAPLEIENVWGGTVLNHVFWAAVNHDPNIDYAPILEALITAGANVEPGSLNWWRRQNVLFPASKQRVEELLQLHCQRQQP